MPRIVSNRSLELGRPIADPAPGRQRQNEESQIGTLIVVIAHGAVPFAIAYWFNRRGMPLGLGRLACPMSLAVCCNGWTFFGGVGTAATAGWTYLSIYLGPILLFLFALRSLDRVIELSREAESMSMANFIAARDRRSCSIAAILRDVSVRI